jgi:protein ImuB
VLGYRAQIALAPVPLAAWVAARVGVPLRVMTMDALVGALGPVALGGLDLPERVERSLRGMGVRTIGQLLRLSRDGLARRFGQAMVADLDRLVGRRPDLRDRFIPPLSYTASLELRSETTEQATLLVALARLLRELEGVLRGRDGAVSRLEVSLSHRGLPATRFTLGLAAPARDAEHLLGLLRERLVRLVLPKSVWCVGLYTAEIVPFTPRGTDLFGSGHRAAESVTGLMERLRARLGRDAVQGVCLVSDHRPEKGWQPCEPGQRREVPVLATRPLWLLKTPLPLGDQVNRLRFRAGPERIEAGWWDGHDVARDYFVARNDRDETCWVFRDRRTGRWYLHGLFG